jgi:aspartyl aminopeptidase
MGPNERDDTTDPSGDLRAFLDSAPSPFHAVAEVARRLAAVGSVAVADDVRPEGDAIRRGHVVVDGAIVAWVSAADAAPSAFEIVGAHTDSPGLRLRPRPDAEVEGWHLLGVEVYGGILNNSWLDRDLGIAGRVVDREGRSLLVDIREPIARVPQLAVHLDRGVNDGLVLDRERHLRPVWATGGSAIDFAHWLGERIGREPHWWELGLLDVQPAAVLGADRSLLASGRLDNLVSCWAATDALVSAAPRPGSIAVMVLNDHEEVGSASATGAAGPLLERVLTRVTAAHLDDPNAAGATMADALARSICVSADNAHAIHPNYPERHERAHAPLVNRGPAVKVNVNQRYATSATSAHRFTSACDSAGVPWQVFSSRNDIPCGSTIGPITATRLGIDTVDVGVPQLSMHSARELCGVNDPVYLRDALRALWSDR